MSVRGEAPSGDRHLFVDIINSVFISLLVLHVVVLNLVRGRNSSYTKPQRV